MVCAAFLASPLLRNYNRYCLLVVACCHLIFYYFAIYVCKNLLRRFPWNCPCTFSGNLCVLNWLLYYRVNSSKWIGRNFWKNLVLPLLRDAHKTPSIHRRSVAILVPLPLFYSIGYLWFNQNIALLTFFHWFFYLFWRKADYFDNYFDIVFLINTNLAALLRLSLLARS